MYSRCLFILSIALLVFSVKSYGYSNTYTFEERQITLKHIILKSDEPIARQLIGSAIYEVREAFNLGCSHCNANCEKEFSYNGIVLYLTPNTITIKKGQSILLPTDCYILNENCERLSKGRYTAWQDTCVFIASSWKGSFDYWVGNELIIPAGSILKFEGGSFNNGIINLSGSIIESFPVKVFYSSLVYNVGTNTISAKWFFNNGDSINSTVLDYFDNNEINFDGLSLTSNRPVSFSSANWKNLTLTSPMITIGRKTPVLSSIPICKPLRGDECAESHTIDVDIDLIDYKGYIITLSTGKHVNFDWREDNDKPTLYKGVTSIIESAKKNTIVIEDYIESFQKEYKYLSSHNKETIINSKGFIYEPCKVKLDNCIFISSQRTQTGFMYILSGKDINIRNCKWDGGENGTLCLLGINRTVGGIIENCTFTGAYYEGTQTSYGLQLFNSTRINTQNCYFSLNRRGYDVSGDFCQTRYCTIENCKVFGVPLYAEGSGIGGHSTSYGNVFRSNIIEGSSASIGIQTRGESEIIEGNIFLGSYRGAAITCVDNTIIKNNSCHYASSPSFVWIESASIEGNTIVIEGNSFKGGHLVRGQSVLSCNVFIWNNLFRFTSTHSSLTPNGNDVRVTTNNNCMIKDAKNAILYYKLDTSVYPAKPLKKGTQDVTDLNLKSDDCIIH